MSYEQPERFCPLCAVKMRSDCMRRHLLTHRTLLTDETPDNWRRVPGKQLFVKVEPAVPGIRTEKVLCAICLDCANHTKYPRLIKTDNMKGTIDAHVCKPKQERAARKPRSPGAATPTATTASKDSDDEEDDILKTLTPEGEMAEGLITQIRQRIIKRQSGKAPEVMKQILAALYSKMAVLMANATDEDTGMIDYDSVLSDLVADMFEGWLQHTMVVDTPPVAPAPAPPVPPPAVSEPPAPKTPLQTVGFKTR